MESEDLRKKIEEHKERLKKEEMAAPRKRDIEREIVDNGDGTQTDQLNHCKRRKGEVVKLGVGEDKFEEVFAYGEWYDEIEDTEEYERIKDELNALLEKEFPRNNYHMGMCYSFWSRKKQILRERYGIEWKSPKDLNPFTLYG